MAKIKTVRGLNFYRVEGPGQRWELVYEGRVWLVDLGEAKENLFLVVPREPPRLIGSVQSHVEAIMLVVGYEIGFWDGRLTPMPRLPGT